MNLNTNISPRSYEDYSKSITNNIIDHYLSMIKEASWIIRTMIDKLVAIYKKYKVRFSVSQYYDTVIRLLTPIQVKGIIDANEIAFLLENKNDVKQLINKIKVDSFSNYQQNRAWNGAKQRVNGFFDHQADKMKILQKARVNDPTMRRPLAQNESFDERQQYLQKNNPSFNFKLPNWQTEKMNVNDYNSFKNENDMRTNFKYKTGQIYRKTGVRSRGLESLLCNWIVQQYQKGNPIGRLDVISKARQMGKDSNLKASVGWYSNFIRRNPEIRQILAKGNVIRKRQQPNNEINDYNPGTKKYSYKTYQQSHRGRYDDEQSMLGMGGIYDDQEMSLPDKEKMEQSDFSQYGESEYSMNLRGEKNQGGNEKRMKIEDNNQKQQQQ